MAHKCVRCGTIYGNKSDELLNGCSCGGRLFFFVKDGKEKEMQQLEAMQPEEKKKLEEDAISLVGADPDTPAIVLDIECINVLSSGKYEIDVNKLMSRKPIVYKIAEGKYLIDVAGSIHQKK